ncbi:MAG: SAM-dependent methyltransferase [Betaproteobacteria bacterium]|nr:SAM-dependent methyltransferase [Betaproteobacteria bacterium]
MPPLPAPDLAAQQHSKKTADLIQREIEASDGWMPFSRFMELALYAPGLGYYSAGMHKFGERGDFVTAPEISALFGRSLARQAAQVLAETQGDILEAGAGSGRLAFDMLAELAQLGQLPRRYFILEVSADLRERQQQLLAPFAPRVEWLDALPDSFSGLILGNEVLDAMPVHLVAWREDGIYERGVGWENDAFQWREQKLASGQLFDCANKLALPPGTVSEIGLAARGFIASLAGMLKKGAILMLDYGFGQSEYYHPQRATGTLMCHYRHYAHDDPLILPGLQDITAHVDFTAIAEAGLSHGLDLLGYTSQAHFLLNCGITDLLALASPEKASAYLPVAAQAQKLLSPAEMGELFKAIALGKGMDAPLVGFRQGDKSRML